MQRQGILQSSQIRLLLGEAGQQTKIIGEIHVINASTREATRETLNATPGDMRGSVC